MVGGVVIEAVQCAKIANDRGNGRSTLGPKAYLIKSPPVQYHDDVTREKVEDFTAGRD
jgi:myo-inositol-1-phosphate synthase